MVFFPVKPRPYYMVSGRVERGNSRRVGNCGISRPTRICLWGGGSRQHAVESYIFGSQPRVQKGTSSRGGKPQDVNTQAQVSREVEGPTVKEGVESDGRETGRRIDRGEGRGRRGRVTLRNHDRIQEVRGFPERRGKGSEERMRESH